jgi:hypothetical protein
MTVEKGYGQKQFEQQRPLPPAIAALVKLLSLSFDDCYIIVMKHQKSCGTGHVA